MFLLCQDGNSCNFILKNNYTELKIQKNDKFSISTSGDYERFFYDDNKTIYHHIIDPSTGYPAENGLTSVTIVSDDGTLADGLSTSLFIMGKEKAEKIWKQQLRKQKA